MSDSKSALLSAVLVFLLLAGAALIVLPYPYSADDVTHHIIAREAPTHPELFLHIWGRPGFTILHAWPAHFGFTGTRVFSVLLSLVTGLLVAAVARPLGRGPAALAFVFCVFQPAFYALADGALTETVFAFSLALAILMMQRRRFALASLAFSWGAISRLEGMPLLFVPALFFILREVKGTPEERLGWRRTLGHVFLLGVLPLTWNLACYAASGFTRPLALLSENRFIQAPEAYYGSGAWYDYLVDAPGIHGLLVALLMPVGLLAMWRSRQRFVPVYVAAFYALQSALWAGGHFRTGGYQRFFASIAPAAALLAVHGAVLAGTFLERRTGPRLVRRIALALVLFTVGWTAFHDFSDHLVMDDKWRAERKALELIAAEGGFSAERPLITDSTSPWIFCGLDPRRDRRLLRRCTPRALYDAPPGALILYTGFPERASDEVCLLDFYTEDERRMARERMARGLNYGHLLKHTLPRYEELADFSLIGRQGRLPDTEPWPYYVKVFRVTDVPAMGPPPPPRPAPAFRWAE